MSPTKVPTDSERLARERRRRRNTASALEELLDAELTLADNTRRQATSIEGGADFHGYHDGAAYAFAKALAIASGEDAEAVWTKARARTGL